MRYSDDAIKYALWAFAADFTHAESIEDERAEMQRFLDTYEIRSRAAPAAAPGAAAPATDWPDINRIAQVCMAEFTDRGGGVVLYENEWEAVVRRVLALAGAPGRAAPDQWTDAHERLQRLVDSGALHGKTNAIVQLADLTEVLWPALLGLRAGAAPPGGQP